MPVKVLFVCLGNICRSPTAEGLFRAELAKRQLVDKVATDSAGTGAWHVGKAPDRRAIAAAAERGIDISTLRARQVDTADFETFDYIVAMDESNLMDLQAMQPAGFKGTLALFLDYAPQSPEREVPDPYYGGAEGFEHVLNLVEQAAAGLLNDIRQQHLS
ncbi:low molecular weight protein-tyrosine-phosphatase [Gilvimarinus sp. DA14]|uniref:low molecular weight protein-tyrosine-phosphatase n=1 Tax=Gilvimarinus sp. DA14 TaxID=2956798 RepID=UPI0020B8FD54|nr:low molecular weight protein-tyrosine-phosphatase [Gilvimarinus sp. DA14]UTF60915.1 low molecular weight phosphotyrosine protein phosphatase [Gilvimarinus sp. DA14]